MSKYGMIHRVADFLAKTVPRRGSGSFSELFFHKVVELLKSLDALEQSNPWVTLTVNADDGIWVVYKGKRLFLLLAAQTHIRVLMSKEAEGNSKLLKLFKSNQNSIKKTNHKKDYFQWNINCDGFKIILDFVKSLKLPSKGKEFVFFDHPRFFPGEVREAALSQFEIDGSWCPGTAGLTQRHKVSQKERIEFDHILPFARGGSNGPGNIQILCQLCNSKKRAKAL